MLVTMAAPASTIVVESGRVYLRGEGYRKQLGTVERQPEGWFARALEGWATGPHRSQQAAAESLA